MNKVLTWEEFKDKKNNKELLIKKSLEISNIVHLISIEIKNNLQKDYSQIKDFDKTFRITYEIEFFIFNLIDRITFIMLSPKKREIFMSALVKNIFEIYNYAAQTATKGRVEIGDAYYEDYNNSQIIYSKFTKMFPSEEGVFTNTGISFLGNKIAAIINTEPSLRIIEKLYIMIKSLIKIMNLAELLRG